MTGSVGGPTTSLPPGETGIGAGQGWFLSADMAIPTNVKAIIRRVGSPSSAAASVGDLLPTAIAIAGDHAYVSGSHRTSANDPGVLVIDLATATVAVLLQPSAGEGHRYLKVSPDGATLVSTLCPADSSTSSCSLDQIDLSSGATRHLDKIPGGLIRATGSSVAVVTDEAGDSAPTRIAGIALSSGSELWHLDASEFGAGYVSSDGHLIQGSLQTGQGDPVMSVESVDLASGARRTIYTETSMSPNGLWPEVSTGRYVVIGPDSTLGAALSAAGGSTVRAKVLYLTDGSLVTAQLELGSAP